MSNKDRGFPVDRGWAWIVLFACTIETFILFGTMKAFGILFVEFIQKYNTTAATVSLVLSVKTLSFSIICPFVMSIGLLYIPSRVVIMTGVILHCAAYLLLTLVPGVEMLFISLGIIWGIAECLVHGPVLVILGKYFDKRRGMANTVANTGSSFGGLSFSPLFRYLLDQYNLQGTLLIISGLHFQLLIVCSLLRPSSFYEKKSQIKDVTLQCSNNEEAENLNNENNVKHNESPSNHGLLLETIGSKELKNQQSSEEQEYEESVYVPVEKSNKIDKQQYSEFARKRNRTSSDSGTPDMKKTQNMESNRLDGDLCRSISVNSIVIAGSIRSHDSDIYTANEMSKGKNTCFSLMKITMSNLIDKELITNKLFVLFSLSSFLGAFGCGVIITYIPPFAKDLDISDAEIPLLITISSAADIVGRLSIALLSDCGIIKRHHILSIAFVITGITCHLCPLYAEFWSLAIFSGIYGFFGGMFYCLYPVVLVDFVGVGKLAHGLGINLLVHGISYASMLPLLGIIRDNTGSYIGSFHLIGAGQLLAGFLLLLEPLVRM